MSRYYDENWEKSASAFCKRMGKIQEKCDSEIKASIDLEKFYMLYRYVDREYRYCKETKNRRFMERIKYISEKTNVGNSLEELNVFNLRISFFEKLQFESMKQKKYVMVNFLTWVKYIIVNL